MPLLKTVRIAAWAAVATLGLAVATLYVLPSPMPEEGTGTGRAAIGGPFALTAHTGARIDNAALAGKPYLVFFGFTHCPDICPTTLQDITGPLSDLGPAADRILPLLITVDPERDTQALLAQYMKSFDPRILALHGTPDEVAVAVKVFRAFTRKVPLEGGDYTMDHTAGVYLMGADGFVGMLDMHEPREVRLEKLQRLAIDASAYVPELPPGGKKT